MTTERSAAPYPGTPGGDDLSPHLGLGAGSTTTQSTCGNTGPSATPSGTALPAVRASVALVTFPQHGCGWPPSSGDSSSPDP